MNRGVRGVASSSWRGLAPPSTTLLLASKERHGWPACAGHDDVQRAASCSTHCPTGPRLPLTGDTAMPMKNPPHPGLSVRHDCIEAHDLTITEAAEIWVLPARRSTIWSTARAAFPPTWQFGWTRRLAATRRRGCACKWPTTSRKPASTKATSALSRCVGASCRTPSLGIVQEF